MSLPAPDPVTGFYPTLNAMGGMSPTLDPYSQAFVEFAATAEGPVLDVGACYGVATLAAAARGASVWANDIEGRHLKILAEAILEGSDIRLLEGRFPDEIPWSEGPLSAVLLARILPYFDGETIDRSLRLVHQNLQAGGKVFGVSITPFLKKLVPFQPIYEARKAAGERWPGMVTVSDWDPEGAKDLTPKLHTLDKDIVGRALREAGFEVEVLEYFSRQDYTGGMARDGREALGFIAVKKG